ncbi:hypothetical protein N7492_005757 [Penicillium capsulatum]|uniref:Uncharacterized protein n=1 Tax=Penicillium capsulatum TaxID=69766 RepID=A0A9W9IC27_9EURO|nr:hypothetical protein N7492_005757 [Penicillium capsulatum]
MPLILDLNMEEWKYGLSSPVNQDEGNMVHLAEPSYTAWEYKEIINDITLWARAKLDKDSLGEKLFEKCRSPDDDTLWEKFPTPDPLCNREYWTVVFGAIMMRAEATITPEHLQHLLDVANNTISSSPAHAQFLAALDHFEHSVPRDWNEERLVAFLGFTRHLYNC